ncbi:MAG: 50S ribosomal protein L9 [Candidatus Sungbacteria bacterium]|nr:50S ribosomal protein L9 [Candidatus Sungbacteria bacterium]
MRVILLQDIQTLGKKFDLKEVKKGYARNFLLPRKLALLATATALKDREAQRAAEEKRRAAEKRGYEALTERLRSLALSFTLKVGEKGTPFGSVSAAKIQKTLKDQGIAVEKEWIDLPSPIKTTGEHRVKIKFPHGIVGEAIVDVAAA